MSQKSSFDDMSWRPDRPHNELAQLPPAVELESRAVLKQCVPARAALGELKQAAALIPNPTMLVSTLPVLEARENAAIENIITTTDRLFQHVHAGRADHVPTHEALRCRHALLEGFGSLTSRPLCTRTAEEVCSRVLGREVHVRRGPGTALASGTTGRVIYMPPDTEDRLRDLLANWEHFLHESIHLDPLVRMAAAHYQFEAIHPFRDGNGRTGRILNVLFLVEQGLLALPILHLSRAINATRPEYYRGLLAVTTDDAWEPWLLYVLRCVEETATWTVRLITAISRLAGVTAAYVRARLPRVYSRELVDVLFEQPYCRIANLCEAGIVGRQAASRHLRALADIGVLDERKHGREKLFIHRKLMALLESDDHAFEPYSA